ncbi:MAG: insulinase family protein [Polyangiaceae bacterium]|nr:insulinase family protein [Polyangiaceae bacterium]
MTRNLNSRPLKATTTHGLNLLVQDTPGLRLARICFHLKTGSRYENAASNGVSHFLEHMLFRGTPRHPSSHRLATAFEDLGGSLEATTSADHGTLGISLPVENITSALPLIAEVIEAPEFKDIETERRIIREEILEDLSEDGRWIDGDTLVRQLAFGRDGLGQPITGNLKTLETFSVEDLRQHHAMTYRAKGNVLSIAGAIDADLILREAETQFATLSGAPDLVSISPLQQKRPQFLHTQNSGSSQTTIHLAYLGLGHHDPQEPALEMLLRILDDGMSTRLYSTLCDQKGLCYDASASYECYAETGLVELVAESAHDHAIEVYEHLENLLQECCHSPPTSLELDRARRRVQWHYEAAADQALDIAEFNAQAALWRTSSPLKERLSSLLAVKAEDCLNLAQRLFSDQRRNLVTVGNPPQEIQDRLRQLAVG